jgi:hypothetical protein
MNENKTTAISIETAVDLYINDIIAEYIKLLLFMIQFVTIRTSNIKPWLNLTFYPNHFTSQINPLILLWNKCAIKTNTLEQSDTYILLFVNRR